MIEKTADALRKRKFTVQCFATAEDAKKAVMEDIGGDDVGFGGSVTTHGMGLYEALPLQFQSGYYLNKPRIS